MRTVWLAGDVAFTCAPNIYTENLNDMEEKLKLILEEKLLSEVKVESADSEELNEKEQEQERRPKRARKDQSAITLDFNSSDPDSDRNIERSKSASKRKPLTALQTRYDRIDGTGLSRIGTPSTSRLCLPASSSPTLQCTSHPMVDWQESLITDIETIKAVQDQHSVLLAQIMQAVQTKNIQALVRPSDTPDLPLNDKTDFQLFEEWLQKESNYTYMRNRVASVGGSSVRGITMNIMKFILTNKLAMRFNWAGSCPNKEEKSKIKYPFKCTKMSQLVIEGVKLCMAGVESADEASDSNIKGAIQDWLKLAKSRYNYNSNK